jgi:F-type H+-transporting ATPase subunit gamma
MGRSRLMIPDTREGPAAGCPERQNCTRTPIRGGGSHTPLAPSLEAYREAAPRYLHPPLLNQAPEWLVAELADQHLFAHLHEILFVSLMAEGQERVAYLPGALDHLDQTLEELARQAQALRQEESVEEIEVGLPSAKGLERVEAG